MNSQQEEIRYQWMTKEVAPSSAVSSPKFWIEDLLLIKNITESNVEVIRHFELKRGLNILWAKPFDPENEDEAADEAVTGHAAGKTLFCRMLRYLLGEKHLGNELVQERVADNLHEGWAIGTVHVGDTPWLVARPFASKRGQFCIKGMTATEWLAKPVKAGATFESFETALNREIVGNYKVKEFSDNGGVIHFQHLLPWLTRDQEARYGGLVQWREVSSGAVPMATDAEDRHFLIRAVLELIQPDEKAELDRNASLIKEREKLRNRKPVLEDRIERDMKTLVQGLKSADIDQEFIETLSLEDDLLVPTIQSRLDEKLKSIRGLLEEIPDATALKKLQAQLTKSTEDRTRLEGECTRLKESAKKHLEDWANTMKRMEDANFREDLEKLPMPSNHCGAPISVAKASKCHLWMEWSNIPVNKDTGEPDIEAINQKWKDEAEKLESEVTAKEGVVAEAKKEEKIATAALASANEQRHNLFAHLKAKEVTFQNLVRLAESAKCSAEENSKSDTKLSDYESEIKDSYKEQKRIRDLQISALKDFERYFDQIAKHILGKDIRGILSVRKRCLNLEVWDRGPLTSAAIETIKVLALDFAALWYAIEGKGFYPGFLIHDGPREADMDPWMYRRLFTFIQKLEAAYPTKESAAFQYIITTTEPPPKEFQQEPWLIQPPLSARHPEDRLLGLDLR